ncbi:MAG: glutamyl-tRNA amidotransferase [Bacillus thermozeamaize]|jgi:aspartyl-tRNA(Asn)/glutamyl-tRNA(Gln) amidotransferase subunit A|uniref:Glutamyl-tRNA amidotransferase n=1 Tax=Bacillus thermozeamaize TaxID=230954 RepID=A0A1Y3PHP2_9BACI|nr:MAG: glutamyl-tRNA amidotransferase [Bacillus thermozeamaize]
MKSELAAKSIEELAPLLRDRKVSPVEVTEAVIHQTEAHNKKINAYIQMDADAAMEAAKNAEKEIMNGNYRGPLHGVPMALKDNLYFKNEVVTMGSKIHRHFIPSYDATVVSKLKEAGVIFTGRLNMHEYAWGATTNNPHFGPCRNPWNLEKIPGGSSGGSGAAVAADMTIASLGTDTGGSIRIPASACGIVGLKPTHGRVSKYGCFPLAWSLDHIGPMTKTVKDAAILLEVIAGYDDKDPTCINVPVSAYRSAITGDVNELVIGINESYFFRDVDSGVEKNVRNGIRLLEEMGARVTSVDIPSIEFAPFAEMITIISEASAIHHQNLIERRQDFGDDVRILLELGELVTAVDYLQAQQIRYQLNHDFRKVFQSVDVLITPTLPFTPPLIGQDTVLLNGKEVNFLDHVIRFTGPENITGLPAISVPCGFSEEMPVGLQIIGPPFKEEIILNVAYAIEQTNPLKGKKPNLS